MAGNKKENECPVCPSGKKSDNNLQIGPDPLLNCTTSPTDPNKRLCWNQQNCQKICPAACGNRTCTDSGACCDESCVSNCKPNPISNKLDVCDSCRYLRLRQSINKTECVEKCPAGYFNYNDFRCVTDVECRNLTLPFSISSTELIKNPFVPFQEVCRTTCPEGHIMVEDHQQIRNCRKCDGPCRKECNTGTIDSIATAQKFRGCNRITGDLLIQIRNQGGREFVENRR